MMGAEEEVEEEEIEEEVALVLKISKSDTRQNSIENRETNLV